MRTPRRPAICFLLLAAFALGGCSEKEEPERKLPPTSVLARDIAGSDPAKRRDGYRDLALHGPAAAPVLPLLLEQLRNDDPAVRLGAAQVIGKIGPQAYKPVAGMLAKSDNPADQRGAAMALGELAGEACDSTTDLLDALQSVYPEVRAAAALAAGKVFRDCQPKPGEKPTSIRIVDPRLTALADAVAGTASAAGQLGTGYAEIKSGAPSAQSASEVQINIGWKSKAAVKGAPPGSSKVIPMLCRLLDEDEEPAVRAAAAKGLGCAGPLATSAIGTLTYGLRNRDVAVAQNCAWALGEMGAGNTAAGGALEEFLPYAPAEVRPAVTAAQANLRGK